MNLNPTRIWSVIFLLWTSSGWTLERVGGFSADPQVWSSASHGLLARGGVNWSYAFFPKLSPRDAAIDTDLTVFQESRNFSRNIPPDNGADWYHYEIQKNDPGYDACLILRSFGSGNFESWWYRVQVSYRYQEVALHKGNGGYVQIVSAKIPRNRKFHLRVEARGTRIRVWLEHRLVIDYEDSEAPIMVAGGNWGLGSYQSIVRFDNPTLSAPSTEPLLMLAERTFQMSLRKWHGAAWIFSDEEPIARFAPEIAHLVEMKLLPAYQPQLRSALAWLNVNETQPTILEVKPIGRTDRTPELVIRVRGTTTFPRAQTENIIHAGYDRERGSYYYDFSGSSRLASSSGTRFVEFNYLFPYNLSPNAWGDSLFPVGKTLDQRPITLPLRLARADDATYYHWELFYGTDGVLYRIPMRNNWDQGPKTPRAYSCSGEFRPALRSGYFFARGIHPVSNPAVLFFDNGSKVVPRTIGCPFSHETHFGWAVQPDTGSEMKAHYRFIAMRPAEMAKWYMLSKLRLPPQSPHESQGEFIRITHQRGVNRFRPEQQSSLAESMHSISWEGTYSVDQGIGFDDTYSLRLGKGEWARFRPVESSGDKFGYVSDWYQLKFMVMPEQSERADTLSLHVNKGEEIETKVIGPWTKGTWNSVNVPIDLTKAKGEVSVELYFGGKGKIWIDNLELNAVEKSWKDAKLALPAFFFGKLFH